jgi:hypothetical protein
MSVVTRSFLCKFLENAFHYESNLYASDMTRNASLSSCSVCYCCSIIIKLGSTTKFRTEVILGLNMPFKAVTELYAVLVVAVS